MYRRFYAHGALRAAIKSQGFTAKEITKNAWLIRYHSNGWMFIHYYRGDGYDLDRIVQLRFNLG